MRNFYVWHRQLGVVLIGLGLIMPAARAQVSTSTTFRVEQSISPGGGTATSTNYNLKSNIGQPGVGISTSTSFILRGGFLGYPGPLSAPSGLAATVASASQINLSWADTSSNESGFKIERKTGSGGSWAQIALTASNATSYADSGLAAATTYFYRVRAFNALANSSYSNEANATTLSGGAPPPAGQGGGGGGGYYGAGTSTLPFIPTFKGCSPDLNGDHHVDLVDLSVLLYYYNDTGPGLGCYDLNHDGVVDLRDISILMFYWTG